MRAIHHPLVGICLVLAVIFGSSSAAVAAPRCFPETKQCLDGRIRQYWESNGGLPVFGFPITAQALELNRDTNQTYQTQWLERNRMELHPQNKAPYDVLLGRLGDDRLRQLGTDWQKLPKADPSAQHHFAASGHAITHDPFWRYWSTHGLDLGDAGVSERESLALFGLPISPLRTETNASGDTVLTQWFERARFEDHGSKGVLLGLLGNEVRGGSVAAPLTAVELNARARQRMRQGDYQGGLDDATAALMLDPQNAEAFFNRSTARAYLGDIAGAQSDYDRAGQLDPDPAKAAYYAGRMRKGQKDVQGAIALYTEAVRLNPAYADAYFNRGVARQELGDLEGAIEDYTQTLRYNPQDDTAAYNRGVAHYQLGEYQAAIDDYTLALRINPQDADAAYNRGLVRYLLGDYAGAIADNTLAIQIDPNFASAYCNRGSAKAALGDYTGAVADCTEAIRIRPDFAEAYDSRGKHQVALGNKPAACVDWQRAAELYRAQGKAAREQDVLRRRQVLGCG